MKLTLADALAVTVADPPTISDLLAGDPVLAQGTGFSIDVRVDDTTLTAGPIGGASHALPLAP